MESDASQLVEAPAHWPALEVCVRTDGAPPCDAEQTQEIAATLKLRSGGWVTLDRATGARACFSLPAKPRVEALLHPHLAAAAVLAARWRGRDSFHAGAFVFDGGVWAVLGDKGSGKSSTLASLAQAGVPVVCDDVLVLDGTTALAGPRSIDLRADAAQRLGVGECLGVLGERERWRVPLGAVEAELPLRGWITLRWSKQAAVRPLRGAERLSALLGNRALHAASPDPLAPIALSALPVLELSRPRVWDSRTDSTDLLLHELERLSAATPPGAT